MAFLTIKGEPQGSGLGPKFFLILNAPRTIKNSTFSVQCCASKQENIQDAPLSF